MLFTSTISDPRPSCLSISAACVHTMATPMSRHLQVLRHSARSTESFWSPSMFPANARHTAPARPLSRKDASTDCTPETGDGDPKSDLFNRKVLSWLLDRPILLLLIAEVLGLSAATWRHVEHISNSTSASEQTWLSDTPVLGCLTLAPYSHSF